MNQHFNVTRFGRLLRKQLGEHLVSYGLGTLVLLGGLVLILGFLTYTLRQPLPPAMQGGVFQLFLLAAGSFAASTALAQFGAGRQAALALTLPASQLEKYLVAWLLSLGLFVVVFVTAFYAADWLVLHLLSPAPAPLVKVWAEPGVFGKLLALHGLALWGSIAFARLQFVKTAFLGFCLALLVGVLNYQMLRGLLHVELRQAMPFTSVLLRDGESLWLDHAPGLALLPLALAGLLWLAAYARLTEKQL